MGSTRGNPLGCAHCHSAPVPAPLAPQVAAEVLRSRFELTWVVREYEQYRQERYARRQAEAAGLAEERGEARGGAGRVAKRPRTAAPEALPSRRAPLAAGAADRFSRCALM